MNRKKLFLISALLTLAISACNLPVAQNNPAKDANATITALAATIQAQSAQGQSTQAQTIPAANATPTNTPLPTDTPTITLTPTPSVPMVAVSQTTNCRTGPGTMYDLVSSLAVGQTAQVVGKYSSNNYWIIDTPGSSGTCWLWGQYATVSGNVGGLPEMIPPPTPTPSFTPTPALPSAPKHFTSSVSCTAGGLLQYKVHVNLSWTDTASNEDGYYIYRNGTLLLTLAADSTSASDDTTLPMLSKVGDPPPSISYRVQAFNDAGVSKAQDLSAVCP